MKKHLFILFFMLFLTASMAHADKISLSLSRKSVSLNDSFTAIFSTGQKIKGQPDFSPLETDFDILSNSQEHNTSIINGTVTQQTRWKLVLIPKSEGTLTIPAIDFDHSASLPQTIEVLPAHPSQHDDAIYLETEISPTESSYEQTLLIYTIRLYTTLTIAQATLSELKASDSEAIIEQLGSDVEYEHYNNNGKRYLVIERKYTVIPQHSGELVFSPIIFEGKIVTGRNSFFDMQTQFKRLTSERLKLKVNPIPLPFQRSDWLAADDLELTESWSTDPSKMTVGEPVTWTLKIAANGSLGSQIPDVALHFPDHLKHYLDKPEISTQETSKGVLGSKQIKIALIGTVSGDIELPEIVVKWWDLKTNQAKETILPKRAIHIESNSIATSSSIPEQIQTSVELSQFNEQKRETIASQELPWWVWALVFINGCLLLGLCYFLCTKISFRQAKPDSLNQVKHLLKNACQNNDPKKTETYFLAWARYVFPDIKPLNIVSIKSHLPQEMQDSLDQLHNALYGNASLWKGEALWEQVKAFRPQTAIPGKKDGTEILHELYPK